MPPRWQLDLCFKRELKLLPGQEAKTLEVVVVLVTDPPFGTIVEVQFDPKMLRLRQFEGGSPVRPKSRVPGLDESSYGPEIDRLFSQPGLSNLSDDQMDAVHDRIAEHITYVVKAKKVPTYYRCTSLSTLYKSGETVLYVPPIDAQSVLVNKTPSGRHLPTEPTAYSSADEAMVIPTLQVLWKNPSAEYKDAAVSLEVKGVEVMPTIRAIVSIYRDGWLPYLKGSVKQVAWASEIRKPVANVLWEAARLHGVKDAPEPLDLSPAEARDLIDLRRALHWKLDGHKSKGVENALLAKVVDELNYADEAKGWIDHRKNAIDWLFDRATRASEVEAVVRKPTQPLVIPPEEEKP